MVQHPVTSIRRKNIFTNCPDLENLSILFFRLLYLLCSLQSEHPKLHQKVIIYTRTVVCIVVSPLSFGFCVPAITIIKSRFQTMCPSDLVELFPSALIFLRAPFRYFSFPTVLIIELTCAHFDYPHQQMFVPVTLTRSMRIRQNPGQL